jgi:FtsP/CotA-like multicopper oxidase with cupredoxin domain
MMGGMRGGMGGMMGGMRGMAWAINGVSATDHVHEPMLVLRRGSSHVLSMVNNTAWHHPIHLHGHVFRVISRNGRPNPRREWLDTVLMAPNETAEIAFVADNPGDWMFHCHILEHQAAGMMASIRVA